jgi:hypothetical protein
MRSALSILIEKCAVTVELTSNRLRLSGRGVFGIIAVVAMVFGIAHFAPQFISFVSVR